MASVAKRLRLRSAALAACAHGLLCAAPAFAEPDARLFTPDTIEAFGDVRLVAVDGEQSWVDGGFGKLRSGSDGDFRVQPQLGNLSLAWRPQFTWSLSATVVGAVQGGQRTQAGLSEAYLAFRPMRGSRAAFSARAGLMFPPVSLEHEGADWHVRDSITPSAINSWIGEEVRPVAIEPSVTFSLGEHKLRATAAIMAANDTSGTLLTYRGWALHDRTTLAFGSQPLPPFVEPLKSLLPRFTHPLLDIDGGFARRPGYYAKLAWQLPVAVRLEAFRYDNRADPEVRNQDHESGWRTQFDNLGVVADLGGGAYLRAQAVSGRTRLGMFMNGYRWVDTRFHSAFVLLSRPFGPVSLAARLEGFDTRNQGSSWTDEYDESGWSAMLAGKHEFGRFTGLLEILHVSSESPVREHVELEPRQSQTQVQAQMRIHW
jgi:hypothetical protein